MTIYIKKSKSKKDGKEIIKEWIWVNFTLHGKRYRKPLDLENTKENYSYAKYELLPEMKYKLENGEVKKYTEKIPTVNEYIGNSFELNQGDREDSTTKAHWGNYNNHIKDIFGNKKLDEIKAAEVTKWQNSLQKNKQLSAATIKKIRGLLYTMFEDAISEEIVSLNPIRNVKKIKDKKGRPKKIREELKPFNSKEIESFLNSVDNQKRNILAVLFFTGVRAGECIGLKWEDVDFEKSTIKIKRQIVSGEIKDVKSDHGVRTIPIIATLLPFLKEQYKLTGKKKSFIFLTERTNKHFHDSRKLREQIWIKLFEKNDIPYRNLHQTRGTFISTLISNGEDINYVSKIAGHKNVGVTLEHYSEYIPKPNDNFGKCFG